jgi:LysR family hydrogen peroxide-inducible transcriptional activator
VLVTPLGREVLVKAQRIKLEVEDLERLAEVYRTPLTSPLAIGIIPTIAPYLLPRILPSLRAKHPKLELRFAEAQSARLVEQVRNGKLDAGILALPFDTDGLLTFPFWRENFFWVTHADDALAGAKRIRAEQIDSSRLMLLEEGHCL